MRIIAGSLGGRPFDTTKGHKTHPMGERVKGALFNTLGDIEGLTVLDAFAGSGALSFEAISRGAKHSTAIEIDKAAYAALSKNAKHLELDDSKIKAIRANIIGWSSNNPDRSFDIVIADPPYNDVKPNLLEKIADHAKRGGTIVMSLPPRFDLKLAAISYKLLDVKNYGDAQLVFYRKTA